MIGLKNVTDRLDALVDGLYNGTELSEDTLNFIARASDMLKASVQLQEVKETFKNERMEIK